MNWIFESLPEAATSSAEVDAIRSVFDQALGQVTPIDTDNLRFTASAFELVVAEAIATNQTAEALRAAAFQAFRLLRAVPASEYSESAVQHIVRTAAYGIVADRAADVSRLLKERGLPDRSFEISDWGARTWAVVSDCWLRLMRKDGWGDLDAVQKGVVELRSQQVEFESQYLASFSSGAEARREAWRLVVFYHLAKAAEILAIYTTQGHVDKNFDIRQQLEAQFDRATSAAERAEIIDLHALARLLSLASAQMVSNCIWTVTRAVNSRVTKFVNYLVSREKLKPIFEVLPPQRRTLRENGLLGSGHRSVVVSLPTSSGKTFIAQFRILQALNQFDAERGWVAYVVPTRVLVNQVCSRLRQDFASLEVNVERISPALEIDALEETLLAETKTSDQFRVLVTTPEKLDLVLRGGWEERIGRPLTLVVVDEAHNLAQKERGIKLELLLATINRECKNAQFLLLTPFINNANEVASWLSPDSGTEISLGVDWQPNDRAIALAYPVPTAPRGHFDIYLQTLHTARDTLVVPETLSLCGARLPEITFSSASTSKGKLAAACANALARRGPVVLMARTVPDTWSLADSISKGRQPISDDPDIDFVRRHCLAEFGNDFALPRLLERRVGVHHAGLPDETKFLIEWLFESGKLDVLVATPTIAQGCNFPITSVVIAAHQHPGPPPEDISPEDFWNLAGRAGRVDQGSLGIVALAAPTEPDRATLTRFVSRQVVNLNSTLIEMVQSAMQQHGSLELHRLFNQPQWSSFLQYLAHTYRQIGDANRFASEIEQLLRGTFGFQHMRRSNPSLASALVLSVHQYAERLAGKSLKLVDTTGFSWESISITLSALADQRIRPDVWNVKELFKPNSQSLRKLMGILLDIPELRDNLEAATGGRGRDGDKLARMVIDWVSGVTIPDMASKYFTELPGGKTAETNKAISDCCKAVYGKMALTASWGLAALQSMTLGDSLERATEDEKVTLRNIPARVFYGVNSDEAVALRMIGVPRRAAESIAAKLKSQGGIASPKQLRHTLASKGAEFWVQALGAPGLDYYRGWTMSEGLRATKLAAPVATGELGGKSN